MKRSKHFLAFILPTVIFLSCEKNQLGTIDIDTDIPVLRTAAASPDSIHIDNFTPVNGEYAINATLRVTKSRGSGTTQVTAFVLRSSTSAEVARAVLRDDGVPPDQVANDSVFAADVAFRIARAGAGNYRIRFVAEEPTGTTSNILEKTLRITRRNAAPVLSNLNAPSSADIPNRPQDTVNVLFAITASDSDGLADIRQVNLKPTPFQLVDDGGNGPYIVFRDPANIPVYRKSGDAVAGDGVYSITIPLLYSSSVESVRTDTFGLQAIDTFGDTSTTVLHQITLRRRQ